MKIRALTLRNFRKFDRAVTIRGFSDGVNVLAERNEFGKSTILAAVNGVVFERYKAQTQAVRDFQHVRNQAVPEVTLQFEIGGARYSIQKRFAGTSGHALFEGPGGLRATDDAAEKKLQELLGFTTALRSTDAGIWGTLWVRQGSSFLPENLDATSVRTIEDCLVAEVGAIAGGRRGRKLPDAVDQALDELMSQRGPRGRYRKAIDDRDEANGAVAEFAKRRGQLEEWIESLARMKRERERRRASGAEQDLVAKRQRASDDRIRAATHAAEVSGAEEALERAKGELVSATKDLQARQKQIKSLEDKRGLISPIALEIEEGETRQRTLQASVEEAQQAVEALRQAESDTDTNGRRWRRTKDAHESKARIDRHRQTLTRAQKLEKDLEESTRGISAIAITEKAMRALERAVDEETKAEAALQAVATFVDFELRAGGGEKVTVNGEPPPTSSFAVISEATIAIRGVGTIRVRPQITDRDTLVKKQATARDSVQRLLADARCGDLSQARSELARRKELERRYEFAKTNLDEAVPEDDTIGLSAGTSALREHIAAEESRHKAELHALELGVLPPLAQIEKAIADADAEIANLRGRVKGADKQLKAATKLREDAGLELAAQRQKRLSLTSEIDTLSAALGAARALRADRDLAELVAGRTRAVEVSQATLDGKRAGDHESVEDVKERLARLDDSLEGHRRKNQQIDDEITRCATLVEANQGLGLDEQLERKRADLGRLEETVTAFETEVEVLRLLSTTLREAERSARERYLAPVMARVEPYLKMLLPQARVVLSETFQVATIERGPLTESLERLSDGTREQIAVLTRLAFAEMLLAQGRPAMVILDDSLVFSDDERMERMFDILRRAGKKMQVVVLTCRERVFEALGGTLLRLEEAPDVAAGAAG